jgi:poly-gamma-glutamate synthesis protein (capsule biosynthesis protein)
VLKANPKHVNDLVSAGIDVVSLGNNHAMDGGASGVKQMLALLDKRGIRHAGAGVNWQRAVEPAVVIAPDGTRVAFVSYLSFLGIDSLRKCTPATALNPGIAALTLSGRSGLKELEHLKLIVAKAREKADMVVVALHWGIERQPFPAPYQVSLGRLFVDAGADVVLGSHPHVLQPAELYKGKPIIYSLGNFVNPGGGQSAMYKFTFDRTKFKCANIVPTSYSGGRERLSDRDADSISAFESKLQKLYPLKDSKPLTWHPPLPNY